MRLPDSALLRALVLASLTALVGPAFAQADLGYSDSAEWPDTPAAERMREVLEIMNAGDAERAREYAAGSFDPESWGDMPAGFPGEFMMDVHEGNGPLRFQAVRAYDGRRPDDEVLFRKAYGTASKRFDVPNRLETRFNLASMNKMFTAVAVGQLVEGGKLELDDPVAKHLGPDWLAPEIASQVTVRHLLTHTSGLGDYLDDPMFVDGPRDRYQSLDDYRPIAAKATLRGWSTLPRG